MSLTTEVQARYSDAFLRQLTNPDKPEQTTIDTARLGYAVTSATAEFERLSSVIYDTSNAHHNDVAVEGVILKLIEYGGGNIAGMTASEVRARFEKNCAKLAATQGGRTRIQPSTDSDLTPSEEGAVRPEFDMADFRGLIPGRQQVDRDTRR